MGRCEACGAYATDYVRPEDIPPNADTVRSVDMHHLDEDCSNHDPDNLMALCHACHQRVHGKRPTVRDRNHHRGQPAQDSVKSPLDWEWLSLDEQAARVRDALPKSRGRPPRYVRSNRPRRRAKRPVATPEQAQRMRDRMAATRRNDPPAPKPELHPRMVALILGGILFAVLVECDELARIGESLA